MSLPRMSKKESRNVSRWVSETHFPVMSWGSKNKRRALNYATTLGLTIDHSSSAIQELATLPLSEIADGEQLLGLDPTAIAELRASILIGGQVAPIAVRKHGDGRLELLDGSTAVAALRELGQSSVSAIVISGLTEWEASFRRVAGYIRRNLKALDKALIHDRLLELMAEKLSQVETPQGGHQPSEKYVRKLAKRLKLSKDQLSRSGKIARIASEAQEKIRLLGLDDNQAALLQIAAAGNTPDLQIAKAMELHHAPKRRTRSKGPKETSTAAAKTTDPTPAGDTESAPDELEIPIYLRRDRAEVLFDHIKEEWSRCNLRDMLFATEMTDRQRFLNECLIPEMFPAVRALLANQRGNA
jgi:ParB-like chromosome segregation protein Spo0J